MRCTGLITLALLVSTRTSAGQASATQAPAPPVFKAGVEAVYVDAFVTQHGQALSGLTASDFDLKDNGAIVQSGLRQGAGTLQLGITFH